MSKPRVLSKPRVSSKPKLIAPKGVSNPNIIVLNPPKGRKYPVKNLKGVKRVIPATSVSLTASVPASVPEAIQTIETSTEVEIPDPSPTPLSLVEVEQLPDNDCCKEKKKTIYKLTVQNATLKTKYDNVVKAHDRLKTEYLLLEKKYKEKVEECSKEHSSVRPPVLSVSKYIELF